MANKIEPPASAGKCSGGNSWGCRKDEHQKGKVPDVMCFRCRQRMGCSRCCERSTELICLFCRNWATELAVKIHGDMVPRDKIDPQLRQIVGKLTRKHEIQP